MTISALARSVSYSGDGSTTLFSVPFQFRAAGDLQVTLIAADGTAATRTLATHYTVSGGGSPPATGSLTMLTAPESGQTLVIAGNKPISQQRSYAAGDRFPAASHEAALDDLTMAVQEARRDVDDTNARALTVPIGAVLAPLEGARAGRVIGFGADPERPIMLEMGGADAALRTELADPDVGGALVAVQQPGGLARAVDTELRYFVRPEQYLSIAADASAAVQLAHDQLPADGGVILFDAPLYLIDNVEITKRNVEIRINPMTVLRKSGTGGSSPEARGLFLIRDLLLAHFRITGGGTIDLNGEGTTGIGVAGRIANLIAPQLTPLIQAISGPGNAALFAVRCSHLSVSGVTIENTGESGIVFRNCGDTLVENASFRNCANFGVEYHWPSSVTDGGSGTMPEFRRYTVRNCRFEDIDDRAMGTGNGVAVGGGGMAGIGAISEVVVRDCSFVRCGRDVHIEFPFLGSWIEAFSITGIRSTDVEIGSIGLIGARNGTIDDVVVRNPGGPAAGYICKHMFGDYPDLYGVYLSGDFENVTIGDRVVVLDTRGGPIVTASDGVATAGDATFTSASASWSVSDVGSKIAIAEAGEGDIVHLTTIAAVNSATSIELAAAPQQSIGSGATYAYGGAARQGVVLYSGTSADVGAATIIAGASSGLPSEPPASAIRIQDITGLVRLGAATLVAPASGTTQPCGLRLQNPGGAFTGKVIRHPLFNASGFTSLEVGTYTLRLLIARPTKSYPTVDRVQTPSATADTYGEPDLLLPDAPLVTFSNLLFGSAEAVGSFAVGETVTARLQVFFMDDTPGPEVTVTFTAPGTTVFTPRHLGLANPENAPFILAALSAKSSVAGSTVTVKTNLTCGQ